MSFANSNSMLVVSNKYPVSVEVLLMEEMNLSSEEISPRLVFG